MSSGPSCSLLPVATATGLPNVHPLMRPNLREISIPAIIPVNIAILLLPLRMSRTVAVPPPMRTLGDTFSFTSIVASQVVLSPERAAGWPLMNTLSEPCAMKVSGRGGWREQLILSPSAGSEPGSAGVVTGGLKMSRMAIPSPTNGTR
ncbi:hypothetical protein D3C76_1230690 [compost metagenome]